MDGVTTNYTLDLNAGQTQVLADGTNANLYGAMRIGELQSGEFAYHLGDTLGSVMMARSYEPFGCRGTKCFAYADLDNMSKLTYSLDSHEPKE